MQPTSEQGPGQNPMHPRPSEPDSRISQCSRLLKMTRVAARRVSFKGRFQDRGRWLGDLIFRSRLHSFIHANSWNNGPATAGLLTAG